MVNIGFKKVEFQRRLKSQVEFCRLELRAGRNRRLNLQVGIKAGWNCRLYLQVETAG